MEDKRLLKSQKANVFELVIAKRISPSEFHLREGASPNRPGCQITTLFFGDDQEYYFRFDVDKDYPNASRVAFSPGMESRIQTQLAGNWNDALQTVATWLDCLRREIDTIDPWETLTKASELTESATMSENTPFTDEERKYIHDGIEEIKHYLIDVAHLDKSIVEPQMDYVNDASGRITRKDWKMLLIGQLTAIVINAAAAPDVTRDIFRFVGSVLHRVLQTQGMLP